MYSDMLMKKEIWHIMCIKGGIGHGDTDGISRRNWISCVL